MNRIILTGLLLLLVASVSAVEITEFDEGASVVITFDGSIENGLASVSFDAGVCVESAQVSITGSSLSGVVNTAPTDIVLITDTSGSMSTSGWYLEQYPESPVRFEPALSVPKLGYSSVITHTVSGSPDVLAIMLEWDRLGSIEGSEGSEFELEVIGPGFSRVYGNGVPTDSFSGRTTKPQVVYVENPQNGDWSVRVYGHLFRPSGNTISSFPVNVSIYEGSVTEFEKGPLVISLEAAKQAAYDFVTAVEDAAVGYRISYLTFGNDAIAQTDLTDDYALLRSATNNVVSGGTHLEEAFDLANDIFTTQSPNGNRRIVIALTDGQNDDPPDEVYASSDVTKNDLGATVYTIGLTDFVNDEMLTAVASERGESRLYFYSRDGEQLASVYEQIEQDIISLESLPQPQINVSQRNRIDQSMDFNATTPLGITVEWIDDTSLRCSGNECASLIAAMNDKLVSCVNEGVDPCVVEFVTYSESEGTVTLSDLLVETKLGYTGPIIVPDGDGGLVDGGEGFSCDNLYVCGNGVLEPGEVCDAGSGSYTFLTLETGETMKTCDIQAEGQSSSSHECTNEPNLISRFNAAQQASIEFSEVYFGLANNNIMGMLWYHTNVPTGQVIPKNAGDPWITDFTTAESEISQAIGLTGPLCFACALGEAQKRLNWVSDAGERSILLMADGASTACYTGGNNPDQTCSTYDNPDVLASDKPKVQAIEIACTELVANDIVVYTVAFGDDADRETLDAISECTGGMNFTAYTLSELIDAYVSIAQLSASDCTDTCEYFNPVAPRCGDNIQNFGEQCDFGTANTNDVCNPTGQVSCTYCTELCELRVEYDGGTESGLCGDGVLQSPNSVGTPEQCDFGTENRDPALGCPEGDGPCTVCATSTCQLVSLPGPPEAGFCGDGFVAATESCDFGTENSDWCEPEFVEGIGGSCTICRASGADACTEFTNTSGPVEGPVCGDGVEQTYLVSGELFTEQCDRGFGENTDDACTPAINGECSICTTSCALETYRGPFSPFSYCGDGSVQQPNDRGETEQCDWGTDQLTDIPCDPYDSADERCLICTTSCVLELYEADDPDDENSPYCGDGVVNSTLNEQCDRGSDVNTDTPCSPDSGGTCSICTTSCRLEVYDNPFNDGCVDIIVGSNPGPYNLNSYVSSLGTFDLDLTWDTDWYDSTEDTDGNSLLNPDIVSNNVLTIEPADTFTVGRLVLDVRDDDDNTASLCLDFTSQRAAYDLGPEPDTRLLIREGRLVSGYYEEPLTGTIDTWGPYMISLEVWQR